MRVVLLFLSVLVTIASTSSAGQGDIANVKCDRECLRGFITRYLDALVSRNASTLPSAANVKFTEDTVQMRLGEGLWKTATRLRTYRQDFLDTRIGSAGALVVLEEGNAPVMLALRLKIVDKQIAEVETMVVRSRAEGSLFEPDALTTAT